MNPLDKIFFHNRAFTIGGLLFLVLSFFVIITPYPVSAAPEGWDAGYIIDDATFTNKDSLSPSQIQSFLNAKVPLCDTWGEQISEFGGGTRRQWAEARGYSPPYTCLKDYQENGRSAAQVIYDVSQEFNINPQVLLVLLQKEQSLITDTWPLSLQYRSATGYGCPDTAPCDSQYYGLINQLTWSGRMFRAIMNNSPTWYTPYVLGSNYIYYEPNSSCGGSYVTIQNRATQALYNYTPYQPNQAALDAGWGKVPCGAYGNRNFYLYFTSWFGPTRTNPYAWSLNSLKLFRDSGYTDEIQKANDGYFRVAPEKTVYAQVIVKNIGQNTWNEIKLGTSTPFDRSSPFYNDTWQSTARAAYANEDTIKYSETATFEFALSTPSNVRSYTELFNPIIDGVAWMTNQTLAVPITVIKERPLSTSVKSTLLPSETLTANSPLVSPEGGSVLRLTTDGNLVQYTNFKPVWNSGTRNSGATKLVNQPDGNLVLYDDEWNTIWASNTSSGQASELRLQTDANTVLYRQSTNTAVWGTGVWLQDQRIKINMSLTSGMTMHVGQYLNTPNDDYRLTLQYDGNIVLTYRSKPIWASNTYDTNGRLLVFQSDGNLVLYDYNYTPIWASKVSWPGTPYLFVQDDGNVVSYVNNRGIWATNTSGRK
tara:strand:+ start:10810 stop:12759 length:1950 start_codon:yes stop_codon:yes gene_type:complete